MTKRLNSKHKVDRRLKVNLWGRPKSPFNTRAYPPGQHGQTKLSKPLRNYPHYHLQWLPPVRFFPFVYRSLHAEYSSWF